MEHSINISRYVKVKNKNKQTPKQIDRHTENGNKTCILDLKIAVKTSFQYVFPYYQCWIYNLMLRRGVGKVVWEKNTKSEWHQWIK